MKQWNEALIAAAAVIIVLGTIIPLVTLFGHVSERYVILEPTEEQVLGLLEGNPEVSVYHEDSKLLKANTYMLQMDFNAQRVNRGEIENFLQEVGVEYKFIQDLGETHK